MNPSLRLRDSAISIAFGSSLLAAISIAVACSGDASEGESGRAAESASVGSGGTSSSAASTGGGGIGGEGGTGGAGGSAGCQCVPTPTSEWTGPMWFGTTPSDVTCPAELPNEVLHAHASLHVDATSCDCTCASPTAGGFCKDQGFAFPASVGDPGTCANPGFTFLFYEDGTCFTPVGVVFSGKGIDFYADCGTASSSFVYPQPSWQLHGVGCAAADQGGCAVGEVCLPRPSGPLASVCVFQAGAATCPPSFPNALTLYDGFDDTRACSACGGCAVFGASCSAQVDTYAQDGCAGPVTTVIATTDFCDYSTVSYAVTKPAVFDPGSCVPPASTLSGDVTPSGELTVCCQ